MISFVDSEKVYYAFPASSEKLIRLIIHFAQLYRVSYTLVDNVVVVRKTLGKSGVKLDHNILDAFIEKEALEESKKVEELRLLSHGNRKNCLLIDFSWNPTLLDSLRDNLEQMTDLQLDVFTDYNHEFKTTRAVVLISSEDRYNGIDKLADAFERLDFGIYYEKSFYDTELKQKKLTEKVEDLKSDEMKEREEDGLAKGTLNLFDLLDEEF